MDNCQCVVVIAAGRPKIYVEQLYDGSAYWQQGLLYLLFYSIVDFNAPYAVITTTAAASIASFQFTVIFLLLFYPNLKNDE